MLEEGLENPCFNVVKSAEFFGRSFKFDSIYGWDRIDQNSNKPLVAGSNPAAATSLEVDWGRDWFKNHISINLPSFQGR